MKHPKSLATTVIVAALVVAAPAYGNAKNSMQPAHVYYGTVVSGNHPDKLITLHNGTGATQTIDTVGISGSGGYVFTLAANTPILADSGLPRCKPALVLPAGARCAIDVRLHTLRPNWFRSVLSVVYASGWFNSSELRAHVVAP
jgi:hypothetical protein